MCKIEGRRSEKFALIASQLIILSELRGNAVGARARCYFTKLVLLVILAGMLTNDPRKSWSSLRLPCPRLLESTYLPESLSSFWG